MGYKITNIDGDLALGRNAEIGGDADIHGKARLAGSLKVEGFLDAPNIKGAVKGLFATEEELKREYPNPRPGWCAIVLADDESGFLYLAKNREWEKQSEEAKPFDFIVDSINVFASKGELADETQRAQNAENQLQLNIKAEADTRMAAVDDIKGKAALFGTFAPRADAEGVLIKYENINHYEGAFSIPVATEGKAGIVSAADKKHFVKSITWNNYNDPSDMNDFTEAGVYELKGERTRDDDNLPFGNTGDGHTFHARLEVLDSSITPEGKSDDICITQKLTLSNRVAGDGDVYIRTGRGTSKQSITWEAWGKLQQNVEVGEVDNLDDLIDNGIYSGVWTTGSFINTGYPTTFVCVVINDYFLGKELNNYQRKISQFVYGVTALDGSTGFRYRVKIGDNGWGNWEILNKSEIDNAFNNFRDGLEQAIDDIVTALSTEIDSVKRNAAHYNKIGFNTYTDEVELYVRNIADDNVRTDTIPAATNEKAGVMSAEDKALIAKKIGYTYISNGDYIKVPTIKKGETVYINPLGDYGVELYGKTELEDKEYISIYGGSKTADRDVNYIKCPLTGREYYIQTSQSIQPQIDYIKERVEIMGFIASSPEINLTDRSVRIPSGTYILGGGTQVLIDEDIVGGVADSYGTHYVLINMNSKQIRFVQGTATPIIYNDAEVLVGLVRWSTGVIWFNSVNYIENGELIDAKAVKDVKDVPQIIEDVNLLQLSKKNDGDIFSQVNNADFIGYDVERFSRIEVEFVEATTADTIIAVYFYGNNDTNLGAIRVSKSNPKAWSVFATDIVKIRLADSVGGKWKTVKIKHSQDYELGSENRILNTQCVDLKKDNLKILDIGNSYTQDSHTYLASILEAVGAEDNFSLYKAVRGSGTFSTWLDCYNNNDGAVYNITHTAGKVIDGIAASGQANDGSAFRNALTAVDWDIIIIHQVSNYSPYYYAMTANAYYGKLYEFVRLIKETNPQAAIGWLLVHSYAESNSQNTEGWTSEERWRRIADATKGIAKLGIDFVIPYGTAVQNLRASSLNNGSDFSTDGTHLATGLGDYVASCCYYQALFAPRFGKSITGNSFRQTVDETISGQMSITDTTAPVAQKAAMLATYDWYNINKPN